MSDIGSQNAAQDKDIADTLWRPEIIDVNEALGRVFGHKAMYIRWLDSFFTPVTLKPSYDAFEKQDYEQMHAAVHKLKGTAANLSINILAEQARVLDDLIKDASSFEELRRVFERLVGLYEQAECMFRSNPDYIDKFAYHDDV